MRVEYKMDPELLKQVNEILQKDIDPLYFEVARRIAPELGESKYLPWMLAHKMPPEGCKLLLALPDPDWKPGMDTLEVTEGFMDKLCAQYGFTKEYIKKQIEDSFYNGDIYPNKTRGPVIAPNRGMWVDTQTSSRWFDRNGPAYYAVLRLMQEQENAFQAEKEISRRLERGEIGAGRIVPRYDSVKDCPDLLPVENYKEIMKSKQLHSLNRCPCRSRYPELGQNCYVCISTGDVAELSIKRECGVEISWEDAFDTVQKAGKKEPFCQTAKNCMSMDEMGDIFCNCNPLTCSVLRHTYNTGGEHKLWECFHKSRFRAYIDPTKCLNCGLCVNKRCLFDAVYPSYQRDVGKVLPWVNEDLCMGCGCCAETCPAGAITMKLVDPPEVLMGYKLDENGQPMIPEDAKRVKTKEEKLKESAPI